MKIIAKLKKTGVGVTSISHNLNAFSGERSDTGFASWRKSRRAPNLANKPR